MCNIKMSKLLGIIRSFLVTQFLQKISKWEEEILFFHNIITWLTHKLVKVFVEFFGFHVYVYPVLINLINIGYQLLLHHINEGMPVLKVVTIKNNLTLQWLYNRVIIRQQDTHGWVLQHSCIYYWINFN